MATLKYIVLVVSAFFLLLFMLGLLLTVFHSEPAPDYIEEALEEVTRKRRRK